MHEDELWITSLCKSCAKIEVQQVLQRLCFVDVHRHGRQCPMSSLADFPATKNCRFWFGIAVESHLWGLVIETLEIMNSDILLKASSILGIALYQISTS